MSSFRHRSVGFLPLLSLGLLLFAPLSGCDCGGELPGDAGTEDAGIEDAGIEDAGSRDAGASDAGSSDAGSSDAGASDAGSNDAGSEDAGEPDGGSEDDAGEPDAGSEEDAGAEDDAGEPDAGSEEDAGSEDDAGSVEEPCVPDGPEICDGVDNDCSGVADDDCVCPLLTYACAVGCCPLDTEAVTLGYSDYPAIDIDDEGNVVLAYALPSAGLWKTGFSRHGRAAGQWTHAPTVNDGAAGNQIIVGPSGRIHQVYTGGALTSPKYRYSDDGGQTWSELGNIVGSMKVGGICSLALDSQERPHLWCGFNATGPDAEKPTYIRWDGSTWVRQVIDLVGASYDDARLFLGFQDRPHVFHTYGPTEGTNRDLHYAYDTGTQWLQEAVPFPEHLIVHPDRHPGAVLAPGDTLHIAFPVRDPAEGTYAVWYGMRTALGAWTFEEAIPPESLSGGQWSDTHLVLDGEGRLVILTALGSLAWRDSSGVWRHRAIEHENGVLAVWRGVAYVVFPTNEGTRALHLDLFPLEP